MAFNERKTADLYKILPLIKNEKTKILLEIASTESREHAEAFRQLSGGEISKKTYGEEGVKNWDWDIGHTGL